MTLFESTHRDEVRWRDPKAGCTQSAFRAVFPYRKYIARDWRKGHAHSRQPTCGNAAHEALRREKSRLMRLLFDFSSCALKITCDNADK